MGDENNTTPLKENSSTNNNPQKTNLNHGLSMSSRWLNSVQGGDKFVNTAQKLVSKKSEHIQQFVVSMNNSVHSHQEAFGIVAQQLTMANYYSDNIATEFKKYKELTGEDAKLVSSVILQLANNPSLRDKVIGWTAINMQERGLKDSDVEAIKSYITLQANRIVQNYSNPEKLKKFTNSEIKDIRLFTSRTVGLQEVSVKSEKQPFLPTLATMQDAVAEEGTDDFLGQLGRFFMGILYALGPVIIDLAIRAFTSYVEDKFDVNIGDQSGANLVNINDSIIGPPAELQNNKDTRSLTKNEVADANLMERGAKITASEFKKYEEHGKEFSVRTIALKNGKTLERTVRINGQGDKNQHSIEVTDLFLNQQGQAYYQYKYSLGNEGYLSAKGTAFNNRYSSRSVALTKSHDKVQVVGEALNIQFYKAENANSKLYLSQTFNLHDYTEYEVSGSFGKGGRMGNFQTASLERDKKYTFTGLELKNSFLGANSNISIREKTRFGEQIVAESAQGSQIAFMSPNKG